MQRDCAARQSTLSAFLVEDGFEQGPQAGLVCDESAQIGELGGVGRLRYPELEVAAGGVFLVEVVQRALPVLLPAELRVVPQAVLDGTAHDGLRLDLPVGLGDDAPIDAAWLVVQRGAVVFGRLGDGLDLLRAEPAGEHRIFPDDAPGGEVVRGAAFAQAGVVPGRGGIDHVPVHGVVVRKRKGVPDDPLHVRAAVCLVEGVVAGEDLRLHVGLQFGSYVHTGRRYEKNCHLCSMKLRLTALLLLLLPWLPAAAGEPNFCTQPGRTLFYERTRLSDGALERTTTYRIDAVRTEGEARVVDYTFLLQDARGKDLYGGACPMTVEIDADGTVRMDLGASLCAVLQAVAPLGGPVTSGTHALLPAGMQPGDTLPEAHCVVTAALGVKYRIDVTERRVLRRERITVPAGTFDCLVVREHKVERGPGRNRNTVSDTWYAPGVGYVRHDTSIIKKDKLRHDTTEVLKKY